MLTAERLRELVHYEPSTGVFTRLVRLSNRAKLGPAAMALGTDGYLYLTVNGKRQAAHRLAWLYMTGEQPAHQVTHINDDRQDNRWSNLRHVTKAENLGTRAKEHRAKTIRAVPKDDAEAAAFVRSILDYDPATGVLTWKAKPSKYSRAVPGDVADCWNQRGYRRVTIMKREFPAHRIVWLHFYGSWPVGEVDHINGVKHDNRIENLRAVDRSTNAENLRKAPCGSSTGMLGAHRVKGIDRFDSAITVKGQRKKLGRHKTAEAAHAAYLEAKRKLHAGCTI